MKEQFDKYEIIQRLTDLRDALARESGKEKFKILQRATIEALAEKMPATIEELAKIKGIGPKKIAQFGKLILVTLYSDDVGAEKVVQLEEKQQVFTVSGFLGHINTLLSNARGSLVQGEISELNDHPKGLFFSLKDKEGEGILECYMSPWLYQSLGVTLEVGMEVRAEGTPNVFARTGSFRLQVSRIELAGEGTLWRAYQLLKRKLEQEGLFTRKRELPEYIERVGVISSRTGAALGDFRENLRLLGMEIFFYDARVEGSSAVREVVEGMQWFNDWMPDLDVLVVIRGGGSLESLQAFDNELVARALFASRIPTMCGIGHHRDVTIASLVGDVSVSTPTGAAKRINESWDRLSREIPFRESALCHAFEESLRIVVYRVDSLTRMLTEFVSRLFMKYRFLERTLVENLRRLETKKDETYLRCARVGTYLVQRLEGALVKGIEKVQFYESYFEGVSPARNLRLGYSIVMDESGRVVKNTDQLRAEERVTARLHKGSFTAKVEEIYGEGKREN